MPRPYARSALSAAAIIRPQAADFWEAVYVGSSRARGGYSAVFKFMYAGCARLFLVVVFVVLGGRRDVVDVEIVVLRTPVFIRIVEPADWTFLDRTGTALGFLPRRLPLVFWRGIWTEVPAAATRRRTSGVRRTWSVTSGSTCRPRTAEPSGCAWTGTAETARARTCRTILTRASLADRERAAFEGLLIEAADRLFRDGAIGVIHEREPAWSSRFAVRRQHHLRWGPNTRQVLAQLWLCCRVRQIPNEQTD